MRIAVVGSGGIGGYYGALLARGGHDVVFVARGAHLEAIRRRGLTIRTSVGEHTVPVAAVDDAAPVGPVDLVLFCVKAYDTESAAPLVARLADEHTSVLTLQNGVDNAAELGAAVGTEAVLAGAVYVALQLAEPGVICHSGGDGKVVFGAPRGGDERRAEPIAQALRAASIPHAVAPDIERVLWEKFVFITGVGAVTALARSGIGPLLSHAAGRVLVAASCEEVTAVGRADGQWLRPEIVDGVLAQAEALPGEWRSSMARDLARGRRLEVDALSGAVVRRGLRHGIATPIQETIAACLAVHQPAATAPPFTEATADVRG